MRHAKKRFGQHFLVDASVIDRIVADIDPRPGDAMVEIGPGRGALTRPLLARCGRLTAVELDRDLAARLRRTDGLEIVEADVLEVDFAHLPGIAAAAKLRVVGNLPYNISTPILFHLFDFAEQVVDQHFMLQKEVVERIAAAPGGKDFGRLSVMLQWRYDDRAAARRPARGVRAAAARPLGGVAHDAAPGAGAASIRRCCARSSRSAFSQRRKLLRHTLGRWLDARGTNQPFDLQRRAEEVSVDEWIALAAAIGTATQKGSAPPPRVEGSAAGRAQS